MLSNTFKAFKSRNYRLYFAGQSISLIGTWMQQTAVSWVIYTQTHSTFMLGLTVFAAQFPSFALSLLGGVVSDRHNRYKIMLITQSASLVQATLLAVFVLFNQSAVWEILALSAVLGIINAFDVPARQALVYDMVQDKEDLPNALALNSSMVNMARLMGPAISGIVLESLGEDVCFFINAASFVAVITCLLFMRLPAYTPQLHKARLSEELRSGLRYLKNTLTIGFTILMLACSSLLVLPFSTLLPVYAKTIFKGDASTFGFINSCIGLGAVAGAIFLASLKSGSNLRKILLVSTVIFGISLAIFSHITNFRVAMVFAVLCGFGMMAQTTISNTLIQTTVDITMRGRVISYFAMAYFGMLPLGGLLVGAVSHSIGTPNTILVQGIAALLIAGVFSSRLLGKKAKLPKVSAENN